MIAEGKDNSQEIFPVVDEEGNILSAATRGECHGGSMLLHPVVHLHVFNSQGELYLQKRPAWKDIQPDKWDTAVGGHVDLGESIHQALLREVQEELGITDFEPQPLHHYVFQSDRCDELSGALDNGILRIDGDYVAADGIPAFISLPQYGQSMLTAPPPACPGMPAHRMY